MGHFDIALSSGSGGAIPDKREEEGGAQSGGAPALVCRGTRTDQRIVFRAVDGTNIIQISQATLSILRSKAAAPSFEAIRDGVPVIMDSGIRRGIDVFKALALGADAVALGRPVLYGLALGGSMGVKSVYDRIRDELARTMTIAGVGTIKEIQRDFLAN